MTKPPNARDRAAREYSHELTKDRSFYDGNDERIASVAYRAGWDACLAHLAKEAPEFDGAAHMQWLHDERRAQGGYEPSPQANARWQHAQDMAKLAALREKVEYWEKHHMESHDEWLKKETAPLYASNREYAAEASRLRKELDEFKGLYETYKETRAKYLRFKIALAQISGRPMRWETVRKIATEALNLQPDKAEVKP